MPMRFIHTADWQIGKPFANFPAALAGELAAARLGTIARIAAAARSRGAAHVLVAGDIFDSDRLETLLIRRTLEHLRNEGDIAWLLLPGNHDPARAGGVWERASSIGLPANVAVLAAPQPYALSGDAVVFPAPLSSRTPGRDPSAWMDDAASAPGQIRIGLAHGSITGFSSEGESAVQIAPDRAARARLDYFALGDWHGATRINERTWYAGTPEPDRYPANAPGFVLGVTADAGAPPRVEEISTAQFIWARREAALASADDVWALSRMIADVTAAPAALLLRLKLTGTLTLNEEASLRAWAEETEGRVRHLDMDTQALLVRAAEGDMEAFGADGALRAAAEQLARACGEGALGAVARRALLKLHAFASGARRETS